MTFPHPPVTAELQLLLVMPDSPALRVVARLRYEVTDPFAVHVAFHADDEVGVVEWSFARQLFIDGAERRVGDGDVCVWPKDRRATSVCLALSSPSGRALFEIPREPLKSFLSRTMAVVPKGAESEFVDIDAEIAMLLWSQPGG